MKEEIDRRKKRAERFGMPVPVLKEEVRPRLRAACVPAFWEQRSRLAGCLPLPLHA